MNDPFLPGKGKGTIEDLKLEIKQNNVDKVVIVQTHSAYEHDNSLIIDIVSDNNDWTVGVLNLDPFVAFKFSSPTLSPLSLICFGIK